MLEIKDLTADMYDPFITFIDQNWKQGHIFTYNREIFDFQHSCKNSNYNFLVAVLDDKIVGVLGYIPVNHYSCQLGENGVWGAIWKVTGDAPAGLGLKMLKLITKKYTNYGAIGLSQDAVRMYQVLGYTCGIVNQYYMLNPFVESFKIAKAQVFSLDKKIGKESLFKDTNSLDNIGNIRASYSPAKDVMYFVNRYEKHPIYNYHFLLVPEKLLIAYRILEINGSRCMRIVDMLGDLNAVGRLYNSFLKFMVEKNVEYIDCLNFGLDSSVFERHGFTRLDMRSMDVIIPNYFEPFEQRNVVLFCGHNSKDNNYTFFKGDADQDRPNIVNI